MTARKIDFWDIKITHGPKVAVGDLISVHYTISISENGISNGVCIESTLNPHSPLQIRVEESLLLKGVFEGIIGMCSGGSVRGINIPYELGFGNRGVVGRIPPKTDLYVEITVRSIVENA